MEKHYFTFGQASGFSDRHQVVLASSPDAARELMIKYFGNAWAFQYTEGEWQESLAQGFFKRNQPMEIIIREEEA